MQPDPNPRKIISSELLQAARREALARLSASAHPWARRLRQVLRTRLLICCWLPGRIAGFTWPFLPVILISRAYLRREWEARPWLVVQLLLHEAAHQGWAIWPEWRNWLAWLPLRQAWQRRVYGPEHNAADAISEAIMRESGGPSRYADREISYKSPLGLRRR